MYFFHGQLLTLALFILSSLDFTRLKLVQGKKEDEEALAMKENKVVDYGKDTDITADFDAQDDADVVF